ncbi:MAG: MFS transporter [Candidatus Bathyarchaeota archaeon]|nr:MFS transporter [Candidatus Bathyarchaeota archaeon]MDH5595374.1 MFS transporter [Candidatus Bathyarchaeota archaeon]
MKTTVSVGNEEFRSGLNFFRGNIGVIAVGSAIRGFGGGIISTYVSLYFIGLGGSPLTLGLTASIASVIQCVILLLGGFIADYYGRRKIMVLTAFYGIFFPLLYAVVQDWRIFAVLSIIGALGVMSNPASHAVVADSISPQKRTTGIASLQVVSSLPVIIAPLIGGWLIQNHGLLDGFRLACVCTAATAFTSALFIFLFLKETHRHKLAAKLNSSNFNTLIGFMRPPRPLPTGLKPLMISYALVMFANGAVGQYYILYANNVIGLTNLEWGAIVSLQLLLVIILKIPGGWLSDKFGKRKIMILSAATCAPCAVLFTLAHSFVQVLIVALLLIVTGIYYAPAHEALQADLTPRTMRGRITALWGICSAISTALGILAGGFLFQMVSPAVPFYLFTAAELVAVFFIINMVREPMDKEA